MATADLQGRSAGQLFDPEQVQPASNAAPDQTETSVGAASRQPGDRVVRVVPDVGGFDGELDYVCPARWAGDVTIGTIVRVDMAGRRVPAWVVGLDVEPPPGVRLRPVTKVSSVGPPSEVIDLARWAARRWAGRLAPILKTASAERVVRSWPKPRPASTSNQQSSGPPDSLAVEAMSVPATVSLRLGPSADRMPVALAAARKGNALLLAPTMTQARALAVQVERAGFRVHLQPRDWVGGMSGGVVVGTRSAVWAPMATVDAVVVFDEQEETYQEERTPTWHAREVAIERARRHGAPCVLVSPTPSLGALDVAERTLAQARREERASWPRVTIVDQREQPPGQGGLFPSQTVERMREADSVVAILNRKGRAKMLACASCGELVRTEDGLQLMAEVDGELLAASGERRPLICAVCTGMSLKRLRLGVSRAAEELAALLRRPVVEVAGKGGRGRIGDGEIVLGTEAALYAVERAQVVVFLDFDQELHAPRYRAAEQALVSVARAARICGRSAGDGELIIQTRSPGHRVVDAARHREPSRLVEPELAVRQAIGFPPAGALAELSGAGAERYASDLRSASSHGGPAAVVLGPRDDGRYLVRAQTAERLAEWLARVERPKQRLRIAVDPPRA